MSATSSIFFHQSTSSVNTIINERLDLNLVQDYLCMSTSYLMKCRFSSLMFFASLSQWKHTRNIELFSWIMLLTEWCLDHVSSERYKSFWTSDCTLIRSMQTILLSFNNKSITKQYYWWSRSAMKLICIWCWLRIYCLTTVKSKDYQKFEWHWDAAWWWSAVHWLRAEFSRLHRLW